MKLAAFFFVLTMLGAYTSADVQDSRGASASQSANTASSQDPEAYIKSPNLTPREEAEERADLLDARRDYLAAAQAYEDILKSYPRDVRLLNKIGVAYQTLGQPERAEHFYKQALHVNKNFATALNNLGTIEYAIGHYGESIKYYRKALAGHSARATVYSNLGYAYAGDHQYARALGAFSIALSIDPNFYSHHGSEGPLMEERSAADAGTLFFLLAKSYAKIGDAEHTVQYLKLATDGGYKHFAEAAKDSAFAPVIADPRVREALHLPVLTHTEAGNGKTPS